MNTELIEKLQEAYENALETYKANRKTNSPKDSLAYDQGRIDGLKQSLEIVDSFSK